MDKSELIAGMRERAAKCRRLASGILDPQAAESLRQLAVEIEAAIARLEAEGMDG